MNAKTTIWTRAVVAALGGTMLLAGCGNETGIPQRHLQGVVTLPPLALYEAEPADSALLDSTNRNDELAEADGPFGIGFAYHIVRGHAYRTCDEVAADATFETLCSFSGPGTDDRDFFRIRSQYQGPMAFEARPALTEDQIAEGIEVDDIDIDLQIYDKQGAPVWIDSNGAETVVDENGEPVLDDEGNPRTFVPLPRNLQPVLNGQEFFVAVTVNADIDEVDYELVVIGNDPREHFIVNGIEEGDFVTFDFGEPIDDPRQAAYEIQVGAFLNEDVDNLGNPVGGTSCDEWTLDEESETFWCSWDMTFLHQVTISDAAIIEGMRDGKDNECNGVADTGVETDDADGDGYTVAEGDCNDQDPDVGPFRGDTWGDRKDNNCDGWADIGPDDVDDDGDGYCENGRDLNGDGVCRGPSEAGGFGGGDCNDADARISPAFNSEIPANGLDDDCTDGDSLLDTTNSDSTPNTPTAEDWSDLEETACGTNPFVNGDQPVDADEDGFCDSECLGTVGCAQDWDGDGYHNWLEMLCNMDPETASTEADFPDFDGDGECDGMDSDADNDGFEKKIGQDGDDCNDLNVTIHPHPTDPDTGALIDGAYNYDVPDGIDNDCDGQVDENRDWVASGDGFVPNADFVTNDADGDGYTLGQRDCDDTDPAMYFGNWEVRSANVVSTDFSVVHLYAGEVSSLNSTAILPGQRTATATVPYDLQKGRVAWELTEDWDNNDPPTLSPSNDSLPRLDVWWSKQIEVGNLWFEAKDENGEDLYEGLDASGFQIPTFPWEEGTYQDLGDAAAPGKTNELNGDSSFVVADTWEGDVDGYRIAFPDGGSVNFKLDWTAGIDLDLTGLCYYFDAINPPNYYSGIISGLTDLSKPEEGTTVVPLPPASDCYFFVVTYSGQPGPYTVEITVLEE